MDQASEILKEFPQRKIKNTTITFEEEVTYKVSSGSMKVDFELGGGFGPGLHRFVGMNEGGKTSESLRGDEELLKTGTQFSRVPNLSGRQTVSRNEKKIRG